MSLRYGYYSSLDIRYLAVAVQTFHDKGNLPAIKNVSALLRRVLVEWADQNSDYALPSIETAEQVLKEFGLPIGNQSGRKEASN